MFVHCRTLATNDGRLCPWKIDYDETGQGVITTSKHETERAISRSLTDGSEKLHENNHDSNKNTVEESVGENRSKFNRQNKSSR